MGLDMYLFGLYRDEKEDFLLPSSGEWKEVCYWRKANQIHKWFSVKFIKNQDPWGMYQVRERDLQGLLLVCKMLKHLKENPDSDFSWIDTDYFDTVKEEEGGIWGDYTYGYDCADLIALALLPPDNIGCFFGSGVIDEDYWEQIDDTIDQLTETLKGNYVKYFYTASW